MLVLAVKVGREVIIGDHTVVTVNRVDRSSDEVRLGFESFSDISRVNTPEKTMECARIKALCQKGIGKRMGSMLKVPVYVASKLTDGKPEVKASLTRSKASFPGASMATLTDETNDGMASHQFIVLRTGSEKEARALRTLGKETSLFSVLDAREMQDACTYLLVMATVSDKVADVKYLDAVV